TNKILGAPKPADMTAEDLMPFRQWLEKQQISTENISDDELRAMIELNNDNFTNNAPLSAAQAATIILDGVRDEKWRILVGDDAHALDQQVRDDPETAYELSFIEKMLSFLPST
ncbi:MAG: short-chain dehydrogenase, partial [Deltaproteobacteria bacterium]|nr:short-chain dehydrogenase [Deltaproteobacteria bacterium]